MANIEDLIQDTGSVPDPREAVKSAFAAYPNAFFAASLGEWLQVAQAAEVPHVPATQIMAPTVSVLLEEEGVPQAQALLDARLAHEGDKTEAESAMLRWAICAPLNIKASLDESGSVSTSERARAVRAAGDPRLADLLMDYPHDQLPLYRRPWIEPKREDGYPVELRVYVLNGQIVGVSNYYPHITLTDSAALRATVREAAAYTRAMLAELERQGRFPWTTGVAAGSMARVGAPFHPDPATPSATLDFLVTPEGHAQFLEAGPPFGAGGAPCCFEGRESALLQDPAAEECDPPWPADSGLWWAPDPALPLIRLPEG